MDKDLLEERIDIDPDIEKEISQLQEAKLNATIKEDLEKVVKPSQPATTSLNDFFSMVNREKKQVKEKDEAKAAEKHKEQKKMLGYLKYMSEKKDATPEQKEDAAIGLRIYQGLKADKKGPFLDRWKATKDNKSTSWMKTFEEELQKD